jgi:hypothetical protein
MQFFLLLLQIIPAIIRMVREIEAILPDSGTGPAKLDLVLNTVETAAMESREAAKAIEGHDLKSSLRKIVGATVATFNATGEFRSGPKPAPAP